MKISERQALTDRQRNLLLLIHQFVEENDEQPSVRFIARRLNLHHSTVQEHLDTLNRKGWLPTTRPWLRRG